MPVCPPRTTAAVISGRRPRASTSFLEANLPRRRKGRAEQRPVESSSPPQRCRHVFVSINIFSALCPIEYSGAVRGRRGYLGQQRCPSISPSRALVQSADRRKTRFCLRPRRLERGHDLTLPLWLARLAVEMVGSQTAACDVRPRALPPDRAVEPLGFFLLRLPASSLLPLHPLTTSPSLSPRSVLSIIVGILSVHS